MGGRRQEASDVFSYQAHYYQQRFQASESSEGASVRDFLEIVIGEENEANDRQMLQLMDVERFLPASFISLSNGETRRVRLAKALLSKPRLLLLDQPFAGLDAANRLVLSGYLGKIAHSGIAVALTVDGAEITVPY